MTQTAQLDQPAQTAVVSQPNVNTIRFTELLNKAINFGLAGNLTVAQMITLFNNQVTALTGKTVTHSRAIQDPGPALNPHQPRTGGP